MMDGMELSMMEQLVQSSLVLSSLVVEQHMGLVGLMERSWAKGFVGMGLVVLVIHMSSSWLVLVVVLEQSSLVQSMMGQLERSMMVLELSMMGQLEQSMMEQIRRQLGGCIQPFEPLIRRWQLRWLRQRRISCWLIWVVLTLCFTAWKVWSELNDFQLISWAFYIN
jgi:hypothetical protein